MDLSQNHQQLQDNGYTIVENLIDLNFAYKTITKAISIGGKPMKMKSGDLPLYKKIS